MPVRRATAQWKGDLPSGSGSVSAESGAVEGQYSFGSRFESGVGTNPEELLGAAHAACYSMALANALAKAGFTPESVETEAAVHLDKGEGGFSVTRIVLTCVARVPGVDADTFQEHVEAMRTGCPISRVVTGAQIEVEARLA